MELENDFFLNPDLNIGITLFNQKLRMTLFLISDNCVIHFARAAKDINIYQNWNRLRKLVVLCSILDHTANFPQNENIISFKFWAIIYAQSHFSSL